MCASPRPALLVSRLPEGAYEVREGACLIRVNFRFPGYGEVRYLEHVPLRGSSLRSHGMRWFVAEVDKDVTGSYSVRLLGTNNRDPRRAA